MRWATTTLAVAAASLLAACEGGAAGAMPAVRPVAEVDLSRFVGTWYEIARFDESPQRGCTGTIALYAPAGPGELEVVNRCRQGALDGPWRAAFGRARVQADSHDARLRVSFFAPFWGDFWVLDLDPDYRYAAVGAPNRRHLWVLSRTPDMPPHAYQAMASRLAGQGFDVQQLIATPQGPPPPVDPKAAQPMADVATLSRAPRPRGSQEHRDAQKLVAGRLQELGYAAVDGGPLLHAAGEAPAARDPAAGGAVCLHNIIARLPGQQVPEQHVLVSAHYDSVAGSPGADDNASGVAAVLAIAARLASGGHRRSLLVALWDGEEEGLLGSAVWASLARRQGLDLRHAWVLEMVGYRDRARNSQQIPTPLALAFPTAAWAIWRNGMRGDFIAAIGDDHAAHRALASGAAAEGLRVRSLTVPSWARSLAVTTDLGRSDHASLWRAGWSATMVTDTANFRHRGYHTADDTVARLDPEMVGQVARAVAEAARSQLND